MVTDTGLLSAVEVISCLKNGSITAAEYARGVSERVNENKHLNSIQSFDSNELSNSMEVALTTSPDGLLAGLPIVAKDNLNTTAFPTSGGTRALLNNKTSTNSKVVDQIYAAGGVIGAKAGMHELAFGITSNNAVTGAIKNPSDTTLFAGGSSGGTAAAIAAGIFPLGLGTDTGGSCRIPASLCGTVGYRPTTGRYSTAGVIPISHTLDTVGSLARSVADISLLDNALTGSSSEERETLSGVRIGVPKNRFFDDLDDSVEIAVMKQLRALEAAGAILIDVSLEAIWEHAAAFSIPVALFEVIRDLPKYLTKHAAGVTFNKLVDEIGSPDVKGLLSSQLGADAIPEAAYNDAIVVHRPAMISIYNAVFANNLLDAIAFPTTPITARPIGHDEAVDFKGKKIPTFPTYIRNTDLAPSIGAPGISLPCQNVDGLPVGIEFDGLPGMDKALLSLAQAAEKIMSR